MLRSYLTVIVLEVIIHLRFLSQLSAKESGGWVDRAVFTTMNCLEGIAMSTRRHVQRHAFGQALHHKHILSVLLCRRVVRLWGKLLDSLSLTAATCRCLLLEPLQLYLLHVIQQLLLYLCSLL